MQKDIHKTNIYEVRTGALTKAPLRISGFYKIFIDLQGKMYVDDYANRRVLLDTSQKILPQIANFLKLQPTHISQELLERYTNYGGYRNNKSLSWHIPMFISDDMDNYPEYFVIGRLSSETIKKSDTNVIETTEILKYINLKNTGLYDLFVEINDTLKNKTIFYHNVEENYLLLNGYDVLEESITEKYLDLTYLQANQQNFHYVNSQVLEFYKNNNIIFPRFLNVEFEFEYHTNTFNNIYSNFYGFLSKKFTDNPENKENIAIIEEYQENNFKQVFDRDYIKKFVPKSYFQLQTHIKFAKSFSTLPMVRMYVNSLQVGDFIRLKNEDNITIYEYVLGKDDIKLNPITTLRQVLIKISNEINNLLSFEILDIDVSTQTTIFNILFANNTEVAENYIMECSKNFNFLDKRRNFKKIGINDIKIISEVSEELFKKIAKIIYNGVEYDIVDKFHLSANKYLRLENELVQENKQDNIISVYEEHFSRIAYFQPIPYLKYGNNLQTNDQYNKGYYIDLLKKYFDKKENTHRKLFLETLEDFSKMEIGQPAPYVNEELTTKSYALEDTTNYNTKSVQNISFHALGFNTHIAPSVFNIDEPFYNKNLTINSKLLFADDFRFHWFLIQTDIKELYDKKYNPLNYKRYFKYEPQITSRLYKSYNNIGVVETVFLGVKYRLPAKYENYAFAVYLNHKNIIKTSLHYEFEVNHSKRTIYLVVNKYFDFIDLIFGGDGSREAVAVVDLSLIYNIRKSYNKNSNNVITFDDCALLLGDTEQSVSFNGVTFTDWKVKDTSGKWLVCVKKSNKYLNINLTQLIPQSGDYTYYIYSHYIDKNTGKKIQFLSLTYTLKNIRITQEDYVWCEDVEIRFFDTKQQIITKDLDNENLQIIDLDDREVKVIKDLGEDKSERVISFINSDTKSRENFKVISYDKVYSLKRDYWQVSVTNTYIDNVKVQKIDDFLYFPEFEKKAQYPTGESLLKKYMYSDKFDTTYKNFVLSIFDRNQLWYLLKTLSQTGVMLKSEIENENILYDLLLYNLEKESDYKEIPIKNTNDESVSLTVFEPDYTVVIWRDPTTKAKTLCKIERLSTHYQPLLTPCNDVYEFALEHHRENDLGEGEFKKEELQTIFNYKYENVEPFMECVGGVVSSLFTMDKDIELSIITPDLEQTAGIIDFYTYLVDELRLEKLLLNKNYYRFKDEEIFFKFVTYLMGNIYQIKEIRNQLEQRFEFVAVVGEPTKIKITNYGKFSSKIIKLLLSRK